MKLACSNDLQDHFLNDAFHCCRTVFPYFFTTAYSNSNANRICYTIVYIYIYSYVPFNAVVLATKPHIAVNLLQPYSQSIETEHMPFRVHGRAPTFGGHVQNSCANTRTIMPISACSALQMGAGKPLTRA